MRAVSYKNGRPVWSAAGDCRFHSRRRRQETCPMPDWPHGPLHRLGETGAYMVTASTHNRQFLLNTPSRLTLVRDMLFELAKETGWVLQA